MLDQFLERLPATAKVERELIATVLGIPENLKTKIAEIRGDGDLNDAAKVRKIKELALGDPLSHLKQLSSRAAAMSTDLANLRQTMQPKQPDRADLFGESQRRELRDYVRTLPPAERARLVMEDQAVTEAVLLAHPRLSGLSSEQLEAVKQAYTERNFGPQLAGIEQREKILAEVNSAIEHATNMFRREAGLTEREAA